VADQITVLLSLKGLILLFIKDPALKRWAIFRRSVNAL
jgi:hypothetical protein